MKYLIAFLLLLFSAVVLNAQNVGIGTTTPNGNAQLDISSVSKGILLPRMTTSQRLAISSPPNGLLLYDSTKNEFYHYDGSNWKAILNGDYWSRGITSRARIGNSTDSVGIGTLSPTAKLDVNGSIRIRDGNEGDGKVLSSDAVGNATWKNTAYGSNDRILVKFSGFNEDSIITFPQVVYTNGTAITYSLITKKFFINKSGLYHFTGAAATPTQIILENSAYMVSFIQFDNNLLFLASTYYVEAPSNQGVLLGKLPFSFTSDIYLEAGTSVSIKITGYPVIEGNSTLRNNYISAYLVNE